MLAILLPPLLLLKSLRYVMVHAILQGDGLHYRASESDVLSASDSLKRWNCLFLTFEQLDSPSHSAYLELHLGCELARVGVLCNHSCLQLHLLVHLVFAHQFCNLVGDVSDDIWYYLAYPSQHRSNYWNEIHNLA